MSRKSKPKNQTKALNIPFTLTQGDLLQEALVFDWLTMEHISILLPPDYILRKQILLTLREAHEFTQYGPHPTPGVKKSLKIIKGVIRIRILKKNR
jgi:hypothetical protein